MMTDREHELWAAIHDLRRRMDERERRENTGVVVDYSSTSTVTGWSATTTLAVHYLRSGSLVHVFYNIIGTAHAATATASFTIPFTASIATRNAAARARDNGAYTDSGYAVIPSATGTVNLYHNQVAAAWTTGAVAKSIDGYLCVVV